MLFRFSRRCGNLYNLYKWPHRPLLMNTPIFLQKNLMIVNECRIAPTNRLLEVPWCALSHQRWRDSPQHKAYLVCGVIHDSSIDNPWTGENLRKELEKPSFHPNRNGQSFKVIQSSSTTRMIATLFLIELDGPIPFYFSQHLKSSINMHIWEVSRCCNWASKQFILSRALFTVHLLRESVQAKLDEFPNK